MKEKDKATTLLSVCMLTYNHAPYIRQAIEGALMQVVNFSFDIIIADDFSTDGTREIIIDYQKRHPDKIKLILQEKNVGVYKNWKTLAACPKSKYIAFLDGDDYWIDPLKLQKQVNFLEENDDFSMCFSNVETINENGMPEIVPPVAQEVYTLEDFVVRGYYVRICSLVYRNIIKHSLPSLSQKTACGDIALCLVLADMGKGKYFSEKMAAYRMHSGGITYTNAYRGFRLDRSLFYLLDDFNDYTQGRHFEMIRGTLFPQSKQMLMYGSSFFKGKERLKHIARSLRIYLKYGERVNWKELSYYLTVLFMPFLLKLRPAASTSENQP